MPGHLPEISSVIQLAVAPVFLLTAIGTILAALNFRLSRAVDRRRSLERRLAKMSPEELEGARDELATIARRVYAVYLSILFAVFAALFVCLLIVGAFFGAFVRADLSIFVAAMFVISLLCLIACLLLFLREIFLATATPRHIPR